MSYRRVASLKTPQAFREYCAAAGADLPFAEAVASGSDSPLARPIDRHGVRIGNRFAILPMEGWDGAPDGRPSELTFRRWRRFGESGAKLIWGGEAVAVRHDGRANPNQLMISEAHWEGLASLRDALVRSHAERFGGTDDLWIGLQLTHSGRYARPNDKKRLEPRIAYRHPLLDRRAGAADDGAVLSDGDLRKLIDDFVAAAKLARRAGFAFVDVKHCHGYLGHELLSAVDRPGDFGGSFENRTRFLREIAAGIRAEAPGLHIGVRLSAVDFVPFAPGEGGVGRPEDAAQARLAFGCGADGVTPDLDEPKKFLDLMVSLGAWWVCITAGSPYSTPHLQRPAYFPPSDGYLPPEDPLVGVARQIAVVAELKAHRPELVFVGSGYTYLQDWLPNVAEAAVAADLVDSVGLGRMVLSYPDLPADVLAGRTVDRKRLCRTFSDCTTGPRNGLISGCFPLDPFYKAHPAAEELLQIKQVKSQRTDTPDAPRET